MKVVLVALNAKYVHTNLAVRYLKKYVAELDYCCSIKEYSINDKIDRIVEEIIYEKPDIIGFSCYIWNIEMFIKIAALIKEIDENIKILYGGPEVSFDGAEFLKNIHGHYLIEGEGEETYKELINAILLNKEVNNIRGLYYKDRDKVTYGGRRELMNMDDILFPYDEEDLSNRIVYYESNRGCPFNCKYCLSSTIDGVRFRSVEKVKQELQYLMNKGVSLVKFVDRTFNCSYEYSREIWKYIIEAETKTCFHFEISADLLKEEDIKILKTAPKGRIQFEIGVQTTNEDVVHNIDRTMNLERLRKRVSELMEEDNIKLHLDLIAGLPGEDFSSFKKSFDEVYSMKAHEVQLGFLKLLKGSAVRREAQMWGMKFSPYAPYEILKTKDISYEELIILKRVEDIVDKYHNSGKFKNIINYFIKKQYESPFSFFYDMSIYLEKKGFFSRNISSVDYYKVFLDFNSEFLKNDNEILRDLIKYDYLKHNKKSWIPNFCDRKVEKSMERIVKDYAIEKYDLNNGRNVYVEGFDIDIPELLNKDIYEKKRCYYIYIDKDYPIETFYYG